MTKFRLISLEVGHVSIGKVPHRRKVVEPSEKLNMLIFNQVLRQVKLEPIKLANKKKNEKQVKQHSITEDLNYLKREL